ncbi:MAG: amidohydrolase family protein [Fusobacteriaceae bacterium]
MIKVYKGDIVHAPKFGSYEIFHNGYIAVQDEKVIGAYANLPDEFKNEQLVDYSGKLIIPGFVDIHFHAPQFANRGLGLDKELLPWLETYTFPEETKYKNLDYAKKAYSRLVHELWKKGTTRVVMFGTIHREATELLMEIMDKVGIGAFVGKVNMDRNSPGFYCETTQESLDETKKFVLNTKDKYKRVKPIITPRFVPTCTPELMDGLGKMAKEYNLKVQSHLSENRGEIAWVAALHPECKNYAEVYDKYGLFGDQPTIQAHCVWNTPEEIALMAKKKVMVAHSPHSNDNLASGIAPIRKLIKAGISVGIASDISGGHNTSIPGTIVAAAQAAKLRWVYLAEESKDEILSTPEWFHLATKAGGEFFGKVGSFEKDYEFDALVIDDTNISDLNPRSIEERLERYIYVGDDRNIVERFVAGKLLPEPKL